MAHSLMEPAAAMTCLRLLPFLLLAVAAAPAGAQDTTVIQLENVRFAYAQVLRVTPVHQTLTATAMEETCTPEIPEEDAGSRLSRVVGVVKGVLGIAYDVDYVYRGSKYRSRLAEDPGNRLRIRIGVTPVVSGARDN